MNDLNISGSGVIVGGQYNDITISGIGKIIEDIACDNIVVSGIVNVFGKVDCSNEFKISGISKIASHLNSKNLNISGICKMYGSEENMLTTETVKVSGILKNVNIINSDKIRCSGSLKATNLNADELNITGYIKVTESINCDIVNIESYNPVNINEIVGSQINIKLDTRNHIDLNRLWLKVKQRKHKVDLINGDSIYLEHTKVNTISGHKINIGPKCRVKILEYIDSYEIDPSSKVDKIIKIEV